MGESVLLKRVVGESVLHEEGRTHADRSPTPSMEFICTLNKGFQEKSPAFSSFKTRMSQNNLHMHQVTKAVAAARACAATHMAPSLATVTSW